MKKIIIVFFIILLNCNSSYALVHGLTSNGSSSSFNGHVLQTNGNFFTSGDYPFLNAMKLASTTQSSNGGLNAPITPDLLSSNGYPISLTGAASSGVLYATVLPPQTERPGLWVLKWPGNGNVFPQSVNGLSATAFGYVITGITQAAGIQTVTLSASPSLMVAGQPISIQNIANGTGNWTAFDNSWQVLDVNIATNSFRINTGTTYTGAPSIPAGTCATSSGCAKFQTNTTVANGTGLTGSGRYVWQPSTAAAGGINNSWNVIINAINSSSDYPGVSGDVVLCHQNDEALLATGQITTLQYRNKVKSAFGVFRFLNWMGVNTANFSTWWTRKPISYVTWAADEKRLSIYGGAQTLGGTNNTSMLVSAPAIDSSTASAWSGTLHDKTTVSALITQSQRQTATFTGSIDGSGNLTVISGLTGFLAAGQAVHYTGQTQPNLVLDSGSGTSWHISGYFSGVVSSMSMTAAQSWITAPATWPGGSTINLANNVFQVGDSVVFNQLSSSGTLPSAFNYATVYCVKTSTTGVSGSITIAATCGGTAISYTGAGSQSGVAILLSLNVGGTGAHPVVNGGTSFLTTDSTIPGFATSQTLPIQSNYTSFATFMYDSTLQVWMMAGGGSAPLGLNNYMPPELTVQISSEFGAYPHITSGNYTNDTFTDWWPEYLLYFKNNAPSWMRVRIEVGPNELWNFVQPGAHYASAKATAYWGSSDYHNWYGMQASEISQIAASIFGIGNLGTKYATMVGVQTAYGNSTGNMNTHADRFEAESWVNTGVPAQSSVTYSGGTIAIAHVPGSPWSGKPTATQYLSHVLPAQYFNSSSGQITSGTNNWVTLATSFNGAFFGGTVVNGVMTVGGFGTSGSTPSVGDQIWGPGIPISNSVTITAISGTYPNSAGLTLSDNTINQSAVQGFYTATNPAAATTYVNAVVDTVVNATITGGTTFTINSVISGGGAIGTGLNVYGSGIPFASTTLQSGSGSVWTLSATQTNQTANFSIGTQSSLSGVAIIMNNWGSWASSNYGVNTVTGYEGGWSQDFENFNAAGNLMTAWGMQTSALATRVVQNYNDTRGVGSFTYPNGVTGEFPSAIYNFTGNYPIDNPWSGLNDVFQNPTPPEWNSITAYH